MASLKPLVMAAFLSVLSSTSFGFEVTRQGSFNVVAEDNDDDEEEIDLRTKNGLLAHKKDEQDRPAVVIVDRGPRHGDFIEGRCGRGGKFRLTNAGGGHVWHWSSPYGEGDYLVNPPEGPVDAAFVACGEVFVLQQSPLIAWLKSQRPPPSAITVPPVVKPVVASSTPTPSK